MSHLRRLNRGAVAAALAAVVTLVVVSAGAPGEPALTTADLVRFLRAGISERTILAELGSRGFAEPLDADREGELRVAGATETLVVAVRRVAPAAPAPLPAPSAAGPARPAPGGPITATTPGKGRTPTFAVGARTVRVPVSVLDKQGEPVVGLRAEDFRVSESGKNQDLTLFSGERRALRIAIALDTSGSMENKMRQVEGALRHFIDLLEPNDEVLVITFSDRVHVIQDFTSDRELLGRVLNELQAGGATSLYDAAAEAIRRVAPGSAESKAVVLVTDGVDTDSSISYPDLRELARRTEVPVFSIGLDSGADVRDFFHPPVGVGGGGGGGGRRPPIGTPRGWPGGGGGRGGWPGGVGGRGGWPGGAGGGARPSRFDDRVLEDLANETGARAEIVRAFDHYTPGDDVPGTGPLKAAVESIAMTLRHRYLLGYEVPEGKRGWRSIKVEVERPATTARARKGYYAAGG